MPAVGFVLLINSLSNTAPRADALTAAVPGLMVGAVSGERWPVI